MASRLDIGELRPARKMADGRLVADAHITRAGVFTYMNADGTLRKELRDDSEVFAPDSMASARMMPMTNRHPGDGAVTPANARKHMVGSTGERVERDDDHLRTTVMVADGETQKDLESGVNQVSCGYKCDVLERAGVHPKYGRYDAIQTNIRYNHLAVVPAARAGVTARIRMDAADLPQEDLMVRVDDEDEPDEKDDKDPDEMEEEMEEGDLDVDPVTPEKDQKVAQRVKTDWEDRYRSMMAPGASKMDHADMTITRGAYRADDAESDDEDDEDGGDDEADEGEETSRPDDKKKKKPFPAEKTDWAERYGAIASGKVSGARPPEKRSTRSDVATRSVEQGPARMDPEKLKKELDAALAELAVQKSRADAAEQRLSKETERADAAAGEVKGLKRDLDQAKIRIDEAAKIDVASKDDKIVELTERIDAAERVIAEFPEKLAAGVKARVELEKAASGVLGDKFVADGLTDREIMVAVVEKRGGSITNESDAELRGEFRAAVRGDAAWKESAAKVANATKHQQDEAAKAQRNDAANPNVKTKDAWKQPLPGARKGA